jgi:hypothetical protein
VSIDAVLLEPIDHHVEARQNIDVFSVSLELLRKDQSLSRRDDCTSDSKPPSNREVKVAW